VTESRIMPLMLKVRKSEQQDIDVMEKILGSLDSRYSPCSWLAHTLFSVPNNWDWVKMITNRAFPTQFFSTKQSFSTRKTELNSFSHCSLLGKHNQTP
jgi:hypothetical protein